MKDSVLPRALLDNIFEGAYFVEPDRRIIYWNKSAERITGYSAKDMVGKYCWDNILRHVDDEGRPLCFIDCPLAATVKDGKSREAEVYLRHRRGYRLPVTVRCSRVTENKKVVGGLELFSDNSPKKVIQDENQRLRELAALDSLTALGNRRSLEEAVKARLSELRRYRRGFGLLLMDIDRFKRVNDRFGHQIGDAVLKVIAATLKNNVRSDEGAYRWGGEEFVVVVSPDERNSAGLRAAAERLRLLIKNSGVRLDETWIGVTVTLGAALARPDDTEETLIQRADGLMYTGKALGRDCCVIDRPAA